MKVKKVLLIVPPSGFYVREDRCQCRVRTTYRPPITLAYAAAILKQSGVECRIIDCPIQGIGWLSLKRILKENKPDMILVHMNLPTFHKDIKVFDIAKRIDKRILTVAKGADLFVNDREVMERLKSLDLVIRGEIDFVVREIATNDDFSKIKGITYRHDGDIIRNNDRTLLTNLDELPFPARDLLDNYLYIRPDTKEILTVIQVSRGCPRQCIFCLAPYVSGSNLRMRSPENVLDEIRECAQRYGIKNFFFSADTFTWEKTWLTELCQQIIDSGLNISWACNSRVDTFDEERAYWMRKAGCWLVGFGVESGNQEMLNKMKKGITLEQVHRAISICRQKGLKSYIFLIMGLPWESEETIRETMSFVKRVNPDFLEYLLADPFPGTEYGRIAQEYGLFKRNNPLYFRPSRKTLYLSERNILRLYRRATLDYFIRPSYIAQALRQAKSPRALWNTVIHGIKRIYASTLT